MEEGGRKWKGVKRRERKVSELMGKVNGKETFGTVIDDGCVS